MNIIFMRHGEATDNVREIISDREIYWSTLTENGLNTAEETIKGLPSVIDKIYVSPLPRTIQTASLVYPKYPKAEIVIDGRIREINHGKYSGKQNNEDLDRTREMQVAGDYFVRFGQYGENKMGIEQRLSSFLMDVFKDNFDTNTIMIVAHGSVTSFMKRILNIKTPHIKTGKAEVFTDVSKVAVLKYVKLLDSIKNREVSKRLEVVSKLDINGKLKNSLAMLVKKEFNNIEISDEVFNNYIDGLSTKSLICDTKSKFSDGVRLVCFYYNFENFADKWINHYIDLGVKNFILISNNSTDSSTSKLTKFLGKVNIDFWHIDEMYNCYKMCGWKQKILESYGSGEFLFVDSDELFAYKNYKKQVLNDFIKTKKSKYIKSLMIDTYSKNGVEDENLDNYIYADGTGYKKTLNPSYGERFFGGYRMRVFGIRPSLQKIPFITYSGSEVYINDHFCYPWSINKKAKFCSFLLHYKFLNGDIKKYTDFVNDKRHWNDSHEYKVYMDNLDSCKHTFYDKNVSVNVNELIKKFK